MEASSALYLWDHHSTC